MDKHTTTYCKTIIEQHSCKILTRNKDGEAGSLISNHSYIFKLSLPSPFLHTIIHTHQIYTQTLILQSPVAMTVLTYRVCGYDLDCAYREQNKDDGEGDPEYILDNWHLNKLEAKDTLSCESK